MLSVGLVLHMQKFHCYAFCWLCFLSTCPQICTEPAPLEPGGATAYTYQPAVVEGEKAVEAALSEGLYPVIDKTVDVFAIPGVTGNGTACAVCCL